ncbi:PhzF family phenazine biosynthesis protein [Streptomyces sioyaensis]|uniref:PhzF family phenazine biosynthesis protein n=1 Tax=Streptomyces sioyaensis TaxID=67364 RepID=UPI0037BD9D49
MMHAYMVADAFTSTRLEGNPVAVFLDAADIPGPRMQRIAREMNLSETTFVLPPQEGGDARIRIFTPVNELPFAGHPMLGTAIVLGESIRANRLRLETGMGVIPFVFDRGDDGKIVSARMKQPIPTWEIYEHDEELLAALGLDASTLPVTAYRNGPRHVYVGLESIEALSALEPDHKALAKFTDMAANCFAGSGTHWRNRMFSPAYGVVEDAATGSAAGPLALHLARHGLIKFDEQIEIQQGVEMGRLSTMFATATGKAEHVESIEVGGSAVIVARAGLMV